MGKITGSCLCGAVRYETGAEPVLMGICHCKHCRKQSGSAFSMLVAVPKGSLALSGEPLAEFRDVGDSGQPVIRKFCPKCGSPVISQVTATPMWDFIKAGTLDDPSWFKPQFHMFCEHAQAWAMPQDGVPRIPRNPPPRTASTLR
jgi:hypothetical protein